MQNGIPDNALAIAMKIFLLFEYVDGMAELDLPKATALIEAYAARRVQEALRGQRGKIGFT